MVARHARRLRGQVELAPRDPPPNKALQLPPRAHLQFWRGTVWHRALRCSAGGQRPCRSGVPGSSGGRRDTVTDSKQPIAIVAAEAPPRERPSIYPEAFSDVVSGRQKHPLGDLFGLQNFGVNLTRLIPGAATALRHAHARQDEFIFVLSGEPTLITNAGEMGLKAGMCAGFGSATGDAHQLVNHTQSEVVILEVGDRTPGDSVTYPDDDLRAVLLDGKWQFTHKDGTPY